MQPHAAIAISPPAPRVAMTMPRSEPPMPMLTMSVKRPPVKPVIRPSCTPVDEVAHLRRAAARTSGITSTPSIKHRRDRTGCAAPCAVPARSSVLLTFSPANSARDARFEPAARASASSSSQRLGGHALTREVVQQVERRRRSAAETVGPASNSSRRCRGASCVGVRLQCLPLRQIVRVSSRT